MSLIKVSSKGQSLTCDELDNNFDYVLDLANSTGELSCTKISQTSLSTCLSANNVIIGIQTGISSNATAIGQVSQDLNDAQTTLQNNINNLITLVGNQNTTIADLTTQIGSLISGFNALNSTVAAFNSRLLSVEGRLISVEEAIASGFIILWSGLVSAIPVGWLFCNGTNGTPDLRDRFIVGAGNVYGINTIGGSSTHTHTLSGSTGGTSLTISQMPQHNHAVTDLGHQHLIGPMQPAFSASGSQYNAAGAFGNNTDPNSRSLTTLVPSGIIINSAGANEAHSHTFSSSTATTNNIPPYYALAFIMKA